MGFKSGKI